MTNHIANLEDEPLLNPLPTSENPIISSITNSYHQIRRFSQQINDNLRRDFSRNQNGSHNHRQSSGQNQSAIRFILSFLACVGLCLVYALRVNQNIAIIAMTDRNSTLPDQKIYNWTEKEKNAIIASFSYGYISSQIIGGYVADKFNMAASVLGIGVLGTSILTSFVPIVADWGINYLCATRALIGIFEGVTFPSITSFWGKWAPPNERTRLLSWSQNGAPLGTVFGSVVTGFLASVPGLGWQASFYGFSFLGMTWAWIWFIIASDRPRTNDWIDYEELKLIEDSLGENIRRNQSENSTGERQITQNKEKINVPYKQILTSVPFY